MMRSPVSFPSRYLQRVAETKSVLCVGLDPTPEHVPPALRTGNLNPIDNNIMDIEDYIRRVIKIAAPLVPVVKFQIAYYAALGPYGLMALQRLVEYAHKLGLLVILDAKRGDIGETMVQYGKEVFDQFDVDACTFIPYLGPTFNPAWMKWLAQGRMVITMVRTSNPEAEVIQDLVVDGSSDDRKVYECVATLAFEWNAEVQRLTNGAGSVGGVVGATWPEQAPRCRKLAGDEVFFLIPGFGPGQGGDADSAVAALPNSRGELIGTANSSRGTTLYSWWDRGKKEPRKGDPLELVEASINKANIDLNAALARKLGTPVMQRA